MIKNNIFKKIIKSYDRNKILAFSIRILGIPLAFFLNIYLSRTLKIETYGSYLSITQLLFFIVNISILGIGPIIIKKASILFNEKKVKKLNEFLLETLIPTISFFLILSLLLFLFRDHVALIYDLEVVNLELFLIYFILGSLLQLIIWILNFYFISFKKIWQSNLNERFLLNGSFFLIIVTVSGLQNNLELIALSFLISRLISLIFCWILMQKSFFPLQLKRPDIKNIKMLINESWPVWFSNSTIQLYNIIPLQIIVILESTKSAALFGVAFSISTITSFLITLSYTFVGADIAKAYSNNDKKQLKKINLNFSMTLGFVSIIFFVFFILFGRYILNIWGNEYSAAYYVLIILSFGQIVNSFGGVSEMILNICGLQKKVLKISIKSLILSLVFCLILTYFFGYLGTAIGYLITIVSYNYFKLNTVKKYTNEIS
jgi:O-antigen/teichoic acid export membrane protein